MNVAWLFSHALWLRPYITRDVKISVDLSLARYWTNDTNSVRHYTRIYFTLPYKERYKTRTINNNNRLDVREMR